MGAVTTRPITIEEFQKLDFPKDRNLELHNGEIVEVPFPSIAHKLLQQRMSDLLRRALPNAFVLEEMPFQIEVTNDMRSADVGVATSERGRVSLTKGIVSGAPELVVEVLSPSNTIIGMKDYQRLCFEHGTKIFLTVDPSDNTVEVQVEGGQKTTLRVGDTLQLSLLGEQASIPVTSVFAGITLPEPAPAS
jgi:Uma2 family endonuclease